MKKLSEEELAFQKHTSLLLGKMIYRCDKVQVYELKGYPNRVVKIVGGKDLISINARLKVIETIKKSKNQSVVKIYQADRFDWQHLCGKTTVHAKSYFYVMERLMLPKANKTRTNNAEEVWWALQKGDLPDHRKLNRRIRIFIKRALLLPYHYTDVHQWNILQNKQGTYKFIDLESFSTIKRKIK